MYLNNKKLGNEYEKQLCEIFVKAGFTTYRTPTKFSGQPSDFIIARNNKVAFIDSKHCSKAKFNFGDIRENQDFSFRYNYRNGNTLCGFAIYFDCYEKWYFLSYGVYLELEKQCKSTASIREMLELEEFIGKI